MTSHKTPIAKNMPKHFANIKYDLACSEPYLWMRKAQEVRRAADVLWSQFTIELKAFSNGEDSEEPFFGDVAVMLYGLTIENLLKAGLAAKGLAISSKGNFGQKSHNLQSLSADFGLALLPEEAELLERLQHFVEWVGRYPIPLYREGLYPRDLLDGSKSVLYGLSTADGGHITNLIQKIEALLPTDEEVRVSYADSSTKLKS
jgi:hypothetical protein